MDILIVDQGAVGLALAHRCAQYGHDVYWFVEDKPENYVELVGKGYEGITKVKNFLSWVPKVDLTVCTENGSFIEKLDKLKKQGFMIYTPSAEAVELEINRGKGMEFLEDHGIEVPEFMTFTSLDQVSAFVRQE